MKNYKDNPLHYFLTCLAVTFMIMAIACSPVTPIEVTRVSQVTVEIETSEPITQVIEPTSAATADSPTLSATTTLTPTPLPLAPPTNTATPVPIISPLQKAEELPESNFPFPTLGITADGTLLAISAGGDEDALYIYDIFNQTIRWRLGEENTGGTTGYSSLTFSPDGKYLAAWDNGYSLFVWDMDTGEVLYRISFEPDDEISIHGVSYSPDGQLLALSSLNSPALIYSVATGELVDTFPSPNIVTYPPTDSGNHFLKPDHHYGEIFGAEFVPNHTTLLAITVFADPFAEGEGVTGGLYFWDMEAQSLESTITGEGGYSIIVSPNGQFLVTRIDEQLVGWDVANNREAFRIKNIEGNADLISIANTGFFTTLSRTEGLKIWDFSGELIATLNTDRRIRDVVFTPQGRLLIAYSSEDNPSPIEVWEIHD